MQSLNLKSESSVDTRLYDSIRKKWVEKTPEEVVRQSLVQKMIGALGYPASLLSIEKELSQLPHLSLVKKQEIPKRRADIIVFAREIHPKYSLFPLLMIECKVTKLTPKFLAQVVGYNHIVKAPFLAVANEEQVLTGFFDQKEGNYRFEEGIPDYGTLLSACQIL